MASKGKRNKGKLEFAKRGRRCSPESGLYYYSECGGYILYRSDRLCGIKIKPERWVAYDATDGNPHIISRHPSRKSAERACNKFDKSHTG